MKKTKIEDLYENENLGFECKIVKDADYKHIEFLGFADEPSNSDNYINLPLNKLKDLRNFINEILKEEGLE